MMLFDGIRQEALPSISQRLLGSVVKAPNPTLLTPYTMKTCSLRKKKVPFSHGGAGSIYISQKCVPKILALIKASSISVYTL